MTTLSTGRKPQCGEPECTKWVQSRGRCKAHGGGVRCRDPRCHKFAQTRGLCVAHGGGRRCAFNGCGKLAQQKGLCLFHGGGQRCRMEGCQKYVQLRGCCMAHAKQLLEVGDPTQTPIKMDILFKCHVPSSKLSIAFVMNPPVPPDKSFNVHDPITPNLPTVSTLEYPRNVDRQTLKPSSISILGPKSVKDLSEDPIVSRKRGKLSVVGRPYPGNATTSAVNPPVRGFTPPPS